MGMMEREQFDRDFEIRRDGRIHQAPVNVDCMTPEELEIACSHPALHAYVQAYARVALQARELRLAGQIADALRHEDYLVTAYSQIPERLRW